jgi:S1-C subfamily serine protease
LLAAWDRLQERIAAAVARARESVVALEYTASDGPDDTRRVATGVVINKRGEILSIRIDPPPTRPAPGTRRNLAPIVARDFLGRRHMVRWVAADPETGLTLLQVSPSALRPISSSASGPNLGCPVFVVGSPFGMGHSVSRGHVAGLDRALELGTGQLGGLIQVQAPLYPGDSGAAVVDARGAWLGVIRGGLAIPGAGPGAESGSAAMTRPTSPRPEGADPDDRDTDFGFAIPTHVALWVADQLRTNGYVDRAYLGVQIESAPIAVIGSLTTSWEPSPATSATVESGVVPATPGAGDGARVRDVVPGTPAATAGLRPGDRIIALDGQAIRSQHDLIDRLDRIPARITILLSVLRGEGSAQSRIELSVRTASRPDSKPAGRGPASSPTATVTATPRASVPVTPTASRTAPADSAPAQAQSPRPAPAEAGPAPAAASPPRQRAAEPATTAPPPTDRPTHPTSGPNPTASFQELRHTLPQGFVERVERLEQRLDRLETTSTPTVAPDLAASRPTAPARRP